MEWFARRAGRAFPAPVVVEGLASPVEDRCRSAGRAAGSSRVAAIRERDPELVEAEAARLVGVFAELFDRVPEGGRALAVGHSPLIEAGVFGLTGRVVEPLGECEVVALALEGGAWGVEELRLEAGAGEGPKAPGGSFSIRAGAGAGPGGTGCGRTPGRAALLRGSRSAGPPR